MSLWWKDRARFAAWLVILVPLAALLRPVLWIPLDQRSYNYFHSKRAVTPWDDVAVVGIDNISVQTVFERPIYPLSRHQDQHANLTRRLDEAGARAIAFDLTLDSESFPNAPLVMAEAFRQSGRVSLVAGIGGVDIATPEGIIRILNSTSPDPLLIQASQGAFSADVRIDADGTLRRFHPSKPKVETLPEHLAGRRIDRPIPILFPSVERPIPIVSYREILAGAPEALAAVRDKIVFVGAVESGLADEVAVPRRQDLGGGRIGYRLAGCVALAAITQTIAKGAPLKDASPLTVLAWNVAWSLALIALLPRDKPGWAAVLLVIVIAAAMGATAFMHIAGNLVLPAGYLFGTLFLTGSSVLISSHLETSRRFHREEAENERIQKELRVARETQERFLPSKLPSIDGIDIWGANLSSLEVSGDYYDVLDLGEGRPLVIGIADVSGKGLPAAMVMSNVQAGLHTLLLQEKFAVGPAMTTLNQVVCGNVSAGRFVTMFLAEMDKNGRAMRYVLAGHDPPLQITRAGGVRKLEEAGTFFLGLSSNTSYKPGNAVLSAGDVVCLYTDGITEAMDQDEAFFGEDRLQSVLLDSREKSAQEIGAAVLGAVKEHSRGTQQADDITLVVIKVTEKEESPWSSARP